nr:2Fe-2S iron-sulfur cluster-binding protein [Pseudomonas putida]
MCQWCSGGHHSCTGVRPCCSQSGLCGTCKIRYLEGEVDHQDYILDDSEKSTCLTACVSRAKSKSIVLDL